MRLPVLRFLLLVVCTACLRAASWAPIPPEVWAMKEDPAQGVVGAVVLEERLTFTGTCIKHVLRVRVLAEGGKEAVEFRHFLPEANNIEGRTVQPGGAVTEFDKLKDFSKKTTKEGDSEEAVMVLMPPGVTSNCLVEMRWEDRAYGGPEHPIPDSLGKSAEWRLGGSFKVLSLVVEIWPAFPWSASMEHGTAKAPDITKEGRHTTYTFHDLAGLKPSPFTLESLTGRPVLRIWMQAWFGRDLPKMPPQTYWQQAAQQWLKPTYQDHLIKGKAYAALLKELTGDLSYDPEKAAVTLCSRLDHRILNLSWLTLDEQARLTQKESKAHIDPCDLETTASTGRTNGFGMTILCMALLKDANFHPRLAFLKDRAKGLFYYQRKDAYQLQEVLVGVKLAPQRVLWVDPSMRFALPGLIAPGYQGVEAVVIDTDTWEPQPEMIPTQPAALNRSTYAFHLDFSGETEHLALAASFLGYEELKERRKYLALSQEEANRSLKEHFEQGIKDCSISHATVLGAWNPDQDLRLELDGASEWTASATPSIDPFPGMPAPLWLPTAWPEPRTAPIMMGHLRIQNATCEFKLPAGYVLQPMPPFQKENSFGKVLFTVTTQPQGASTLVLVTYKVELLRLVAPASTEPELREFIGWASDAYHRMLVLEKS